MIAKTVVAIIIILMLCSVAFAERTYIVKKNDSLWKIARFVYSLKTNKAIDGAWKRIADRNGLTNPNVIRAGQKLIVPNIKGKRKRGVPKGYEYWKTIKAVVRAYDPGRCCCQGAADGKTALMDNAWYMDGVAVAFSVIPRRTMMFIPGVGWREADDTGPSPRRGAKRGQYRIEIRVRTHREAKEWGRQQLDIDLYKKIPARKKVSSNTVIYRNA